MEYGVETLDADKFVISTQTQLQASHATNILKLQ